MLGKCIERDKACIPDALDNYGWQSTLIFLMLAAIGAALFDKLRKWAGRGLDALEDRASLLFHDPTRYYLKHFINDLEEPKYQPFIGDDVKKPKLEKIFLPLDLRPEEVIVEKNQGRGKEGLAEAGLLKRTTPSSAFENLLVRLRLRRPPKEPSERVELSRVILAAKRHVAMVGIAGSGKSTLVQWVGLSCARDYYERGTLNSEQIKVMRSLNRSTLPRIVFAAARRLGIMRPLFPVFIPLGELDWFSRNPRDICEVEKSLNGTLPLNSETLLKFICWNFNRWHPDLKQAVTPDFFKRKMREGCVLLLDGVDEVTFERRELLRQAVRGFLQENYHPKRTRVLLTSRPSYTRELWSDDFEACEVLAMTREQRDTLIDSLFSAIYAPNEDRARREAQRLSESLDQNSDPHVREMSYTPLLTTIFAKIQHSGNRLPDQRAQVYREAVDLLLSEAYRKKGLESPRQLPSNALIWISEIAFELHQAAIGEEGLIQDDLIERLAARRAAEDRTHFADEIKAFVNQLAQNVCLLEETRPNYFGFRSHRTFQEFLAGRHLLNEYKVEELRQFVQKIALSTDKEIWEESLRLGLADLARTKERDIDERLEMLLQLDTQLDDGGWCAAMAALALIDLPEDRWKSPNATRKRVMEAGRASFERGALREALLLDLGLALAKTKNKTFAEPLCQKLVANPPLFAPAERRRLGLALAELGDPRFDSPLPLGEGLGVRAKSHFIVIPAGTFQMGTSEEEAELLDKQQAGSWADEKPQHIVYVSDFAIAKYPVTNAEYRLFINDKGYERLDCWSEDGKRWLESKMIRADLSYITDRSVRRRVADWIAGRPKEKKRQPFFWDDSKWNVDTLPVVGVSWFESEAYCNWLTFKLREAKAITSEQKIHLPTEAQWEKAARAQPSNIELPTSRLWSWGDEWDKNKCNALNQFGATTPVGMYPDGASGYGVQDMMGNVWEWCADWYDEKLYERRKDQEVSDPLGPVKGSARIVRGGSWLYAQWNCRAACRLRYTPLLFNYDSGFRAALSPVWG